MKIYSAKGLMLASSVLGGAVLLAMASVAPARAQTASTEADVVQEVVVTGSRIRRVETNTEAPVTIIDAQTISDRGFVSAGQALNELTATVPSFPQADGSGASSGSGQQFPNLFGLGAGRTLTLVNGRRFVTSSRGFGAVSASNPNAGERVVDTNIIPTGLIERIDVVQAGGAAVYGSDAIAGVINYVLKDNFQGLEFDAYYGLSSRDDYPQSSLRLTGGRNFLDDRGNVAVNLEWSKTDSLLDYDRPFTALGRLTGTNPANTGPSDGIPALAEIIGARFWPFNYNGLLFTPAAAPVPTFIVSQNGTPLQFNAAGTALIPYNTGVRFGVPFASGGDGWDYREIASLRTGVERWTANVIGHYDITDRVRFTTELMYAETEGRNPYGTYFSTTVLNNAASGAGPISINRSNPYITDAVRAVIGAGGPPIFLSKVWGDDLLPTREVVTNTETYRILAGLEGDFDIGERNFYWTLSASRGQTEGEQQGWSVHTARFANAVNAVRNSAGNIVCAINADATTANDDPACAPLNPFGVGNASWESRRYVTIPVGEEFLNTQDAYLATLGGQLVDLPAGPARFSVAYERREESAKFTPSPAEQRGLVGSGVPTLAARAGYNTNEWSGELLVPVLGGDFSLPFAQALELNGAYRWVDHSIAGEETVWGAGLRWEVIDGLSFRASKSRNFRAPTLNQLFAPTRVALGSVGIDPCDFRYISAGPNPSVRRANCQAEWAARGYGNLATFQNDSTNFSSALVTTGGNPNLKNELSDTVTYGVVFQPSFVPGLTIVVDRVEVDLTDGLSPFLPTDFLQTCYDAAVRPADVCGTFTRNAQGQVVSALNTTFNAGEITYRGEVYNINYVFPVGRFFGDRDMGTLELNAEATHTAKMEVSVTGADRTRRDNTLAQPDWTGRFDARYHRGALRATYTMNYISEVLFAQGDTIEQREHWLIDANIRHNASAAYDFGTYVLRGGVNNFTDEAPSYPTRTHGDIIGRYYFMGLTARF